MIRTLQTHGPTALPEGTADFLLAAAGSAPGTLLSSPTRDAEFISAGQYSSPHSPALATPALLTRAVHTLTPFASVRILDLGLAVKPQTCDSVDFGIDGATPFDAKTLFEKGRRFGRGYKPLGAYVILGESIPPAPETPQAIVAALDRLSAGAGLFERLGQTADTVLMFIAGFVLEASRRFPVVLGGGKRMAAALLIADRLSRRDGLPMDPRKITVCTTRPAAEDAQTDPAPLLERLDFRPRSLYADFSAENAAFPPLERYDDGLGAGAAVAYGAMHGATPAQISARAEALLRGGS